MKITKNWLGIFIRALAFSAPNHCQILTRVEPVGYQWLFCNSFLKITYFLAISVIFECCISNCLVASSLQKLFIDFCPELHTKTCCYLKYSKSYNQNIL